MPPVRCSGSRRRRRSDSSTPFRELGVCYLTGTGVEKDEAEGSRLIEAAAASGDPEALVILSNN